MMRAMVTAGVLLLWMGVFTAPAAAEEKGQSDLDEATQLRVNARTLADLEQVAELCESALNKGLNEDSAKFARQMLGSTLYEYANRISNAIFERVPPPDPRQLALLRTVAVKRLEEAVKVNDQMGDAYLLLAKLYALSRADEQRTLEMVDKGIELFAAEPRKQASAIVIKARIVTELDDKVKEIDRALKVDPANTDAWQMRAALLVAKGDLKAAVNAFEEILKQDDQDAKVQLAVAEVLVNMEKYDEALKHIDRAVELDPKSASALLLRSRVYGVQDKLDAALKDIDQAIELEPKNLNAILFARLHLVNDNIEKAKLDVDRILQEVPDAAPALVVRSMVSAREKRYAAAIADMRKVVDQEPDNVTYKIQLGAMYASSGRPRKAVEIMTRLIEEDPDNWSARRSRANALLSIGRHKEAIEDYDLALKKEPDDSGMLNNLAWVLATSPTDENRNGKRAVELATKACELTKYKEAHILSTLAAAYAESGDFENAMKWSAKAVELGKGGEVGEQLKQELESYKQGKASRESQTTEEKPELQTSDLET